MCPAYTHSNNHGTLMASSVAFRSTTSTLTPVFSIYLSSVQDILEDILDAAVCVCLCLES